jgi:phage major head subunit gpT-like protein
MITSESLSYALDEIVSAVTFDSFYGMPFMLPQLFSVRPSSRRRERFASLGGLGVWTEKTRGAAADSDALVQQFEKDFVHTAFGKEIPIERELIDDCEVNIVGEIGVQIGATAAYTMETHAAEVFNDFFDGATFKSEDGVTVCNNTHVNSDGTTLSDNLSTTNALNTDGVSAVRTAMRGFVNSRGLKDPSILRLILVPPALETTAAQLAKSERTPENAMNTANVFQGLQYGVWDFLSSTTDWFGIDTAKMKQEVLWLQRIPLEVFSSGDMFTGTKKIGGYMRYSRGVKGWNWVYGNNV